MTADVSDDVVQRLRALRRPSITVALWAGAACLLWLVISPGRFLHSYLAGWMLWLGITLGSLGFAMLHRLTGGAWGKIVVRMMTETGSTLPTLGLLGLPLLFGIRWLYPWSHAGAFAADPILLAKSGWLNVPFFVLRSVVYFLVWIALARTMVRASRQEEVGPDPSVRDRAARLSAPGLVLYFLTMTFASIDWGMSLEPHHFSVAYGLVIILGQGLAALAFAAAMLWLVVRCETATRVLRPGDFNDLGNLTLAFVMLWTYVSFFEFLVIWTGNMPDDADYFIRRSQGGWLRVGITLALFHFAVPFLILLSRAIKRNCRALGMLGVGLLAGRLVDLWWHLMPSADRIVSLNPLILAAPVAIGGVWLHVFAGALAERRLTPAVPPPPPGPEEVSTGGRP